VPPPAAPLKLTVRAASPLVGVVPVALAVRGGVLTVMVSGAEVTLLGVESVTWTVAL